MNAPCPDCRRPPFVQTSAWVLGHTAVSSRYYQLRLKCPAIARSAQPGQFVMLACAPDSALAPDPLLPRPLALLDAHGEEIELLYFVAGRGTEILRQNAAGLAHGGAPRPWRIIGPLGRPFAPVAGVDAHVALGGGSGVAPLVFFMRRYGTPGWHLILAGRSAAELPRGEVVRTPGIQHLSTDDGSAGLRGTGVDALKALLGGELKARRVAIYTAGPEPMMRAAAAIGRLAGFPVRVSLESRMACGVGVCRACVVDGVAPHPKTGLLRRAVCHDGPVFDVAELAGW